MPSALMSAHVRGGTVQHSVAVHEAPAQMMLAGLADMSLATPEQSKLVAAQFIAA